MLNNYAYINTIYCFKLNSNEFLSLFEQIQLKFVEFWFM